MRRTTLATVWPASLATINNALMATPATTQAPARATGPKHVPAQPRPKWQKYGTPILVVLLAAAIVLTLTWNWNSWEGGRIEQVTDDAYVWGDITPLSTKVAGNARDVRVSDFQPVHKGDLIVELEDDDFKAQVAQASSQVEAAKAAIEDNRRQRALQDARIERALAGIDQANAQITAPYAGIEATRADLVRTQEERRRQEALFQTHSTTQQKLEQAVADERRFAAMLASREGNLVDPLADGNVGERQVRPGQLVSPGTQVIPFVSKIKWVQANYRETQLTNAKVGDPAELRIDAYQGRVIEIAPASGSRFALLPPDSATGNFTKVVQRITVKIALDDLNTATTLRPGLSVIATVSTRR